MNFTLQEILALLQSKNRCLERLMVATRDFLSTTVDALVTEGASGKGPLTDYEKSRTTIIETLQMHDRKIGELIESLTPADRTPEFLSAAREEVTRNERLIVSIFNADDIVFRKIGEAQSQITKLIQENRKSHERLSRFKSGPGSTGEEMDMTL